MTDESPADLMAPDPLPVAGLTLDMPRVQKTISRWVERRMWLIDRFNSLSLFGHKRDAAKQDPKNSSWRIRPGDPPVIQSILFIVSELEHLNATITDEKLLVDARGRLQKQLFDLITSAEAQNSKLFTELWDMVEHEQRKVEHKDKVTAKGLTDISDAELRRIHDAQA